MYTFYLATLYFYCKRKCTI